MATAGEINQEISELIVNLRRLGHDHMADVLAHRAYKVSWTTQKEMLDEILHVIRNGNLDKKIPQLAKFRVLVEEYLVEGEKKL